MTSWKMSFTVTDIGEQIITAFTKPHLYTRKAIFSQALGSKEEAA
jgi:hypothetical protein